MQLKRIEIFDEHADQYDRWYEKHPAVFESELRAIREQLSQLPAELRGIEVGLSSGRFSEALGIKEGVEPSEKMRALATRRGIEVMDARAELLPYADLSFDFVLFVTVSFLEKPKQAFEEAYRVLDDKGSILVAFIDADSTIGKSYRDRKAHNVFYRHAQFYSVNRVSDMLREARFKDLQYVQTLFGELEDIQEPQVPREGHGEGSFVVIRATKRV